MNTTHPAGAPGAGGRFARWRESMRRERAQRALLQLPDYLLRDMGLERDGSFPATVRRIEAL